jgi:hypothetical protein
VLAVAALAAGASVDLKPGDMATVKRDGSEVRQGRKALAILKKGTPIKIHYVQGGFARVWVKVGGKPIVGYMSVKDLEPPERKGKKTVQNPFVVDDEVVVIARQAKLMKGKTVLGRLAEDTRLTVKKVNGLWIGVYAMINSKRTFGWVHSRDVNYPPFGEKPSGKK